MNIGIFILSRQVVFHRLLEKWGDSVEGRGIAERNLNINFHVFLFFGVVGNFEILITIYQLI